MSVVRIYDKDNNSTLSFGLMELLELLSPRSLEALWVVSDCDGESIDSTGMSYGILESLEETGESISGIVLAAIARNTTFIGWGEFKAFLPEQSEKYWVILRVIDSSFWEIETQDESVIKLVKLKFADVRKSNTSWPEQY